MAVCRGAGLVQSGAASRRETGVTVSAACPPIAMRINSASLNCTTRDPLVQFGGLIRPHEDIDHLADFGRFARSDVFLRGGPPCSITGTRRGSSFKARLKVGRCG